MHNGSIGEHRVGRPGEADMTGNAVLESDGVHNSLPLALHYLAQRRSAGYSGDSLQERGAASPDALPGGRSRPHAQLWRM